MKAPASAVLTIAIALAGRELAATAVDGGDAALAFLNANFSLSHAELRDVRQYRPISRTFDTSDDREVATLGIIRIRVPPAFYVEQLRQITDFKRNDAVLQIGTFGSPAQLEDVRGLTLESSDVDALQSCRPGACGIQLSSEAIRRFQQQAARLGSGNAAAINGLMREVLVDLVNGYRDTGDGALMTYVDSGRPLSIAAEFRAMVDARPAILQRFPSLQKHMLEFPQGPRDGTDDVIYWSKEKLGPRIVVSVTHLAITTLLDRAPVMFVAASKQIYGSHYFDTSLGITILLDDSASHTQSSYLVYVNRSRLDALGGFFGGLKRLIVRSRTRSAMSTSLLEARDRVERRFSNQGIDKAQALHNSKLLFRLDGHDSR